MAQDIPGQLPYFIEPIKKDQTMNTISTESCNTSSLLVLITGGSGGIGREIVRRLRVEGHSVVVMDKVTPEDGGSFIHIQLTEQESIIEGAATMIKDYGVPDVLINCAGINQTGQFIDAELGVLVDLIAINFTSVVLLSHMLIPSMIEKEQSIVINIASRFADLTVINNAVYSATKSAVTTFSKQLALEYGGKGMRVNSISPGLIATPMNQKTRENPTSLNKILNRQSIQRIGQPVDVANLVVFLCSTQADFISGEDIRIDGGFF